MDEDKTPISIRGIRVSKIEAIRAIREIIPNITLRDAKEIVERFCADEAIIRVEAVTSCRFGVHELTLDLDQVTKGCQID